jgi:hypothetical protein
MQTFDVLWVMIFICNRVYGYLQALVSVGTSYYSLRDAICYEGFKIRKVLINT